MPASPIHYFALLLPLAGLMVIVLIRRISWRVAIVSSLLVPLAGELALLFWVSTSGAHTIEPALWLRFMMAAVIYFPLALVAMGPWAAFIGALAWMLAQGSSVAARLSFAKLSMVAVLAGGVAGAGFILLYSLITVLPEGPPVRDYSFVPYFALSGTLAGAVEGLIVAWYLKGKAVPPRSIIGDTTAPSRVT
ncbi:hypothetical protein [Candidatus Binatus sp.]|uniref:hypothetical protein n=1 Tax=Candidatus Binatus sp. TaxID=2811406 RepID=UPI00272A1F17|nr:hypothetical protein [Candidatus Binatus sp.]